MNYNSPLARLFSRHVKVQWYPCEPFLYILVFCTDYKMLKILSQFTTAASLSRTEEILPNKYKWSKASTSKRVGVFASSLWKCTIFFLPYSFSISYGSFFYLQLGKGNYIMPMHFTHKHIHKQCSVIKDPQVYIIIYSISFLLNSKYTYEVAVPVDIYDFQSLLYIMVKSPCRGCF